MVPLSIWSAPTHRLSCSSLWLALTVTTFALAPRVARAQPVNGTLAVSATILPPAMTQAAELVSFRLHRNGPAQLETTIPAAGAVSLIVMPTVSSSTNGFVPVTQTPMLVTATRRHESLEPAIEPTDSREMRSRYEVDLGPASTRSPSNEVSVRISYLIVPGT